MPESYPFSLVAEKYSRPKAIKPSALWAFCKEMLLKCRSFARTFNHTENIAATIVDTTMMQISSIYLFHRALELQKNDRSPTITVFIFSDSLAKPTAVDISPSIIVAVPMIAVIFGLLHPIVNERIISNGELFQMNYRILREYFCRSIQRFQGRRP